MSFDTVEMIKQFPNYDFYCDPLSFHGDVVYIGAFGFVVQWNVATDAIGRLEGYPGLVSQHFAVFGFDNIFR